MNIGDVVMLSKSGSRTLMLRHRRNKIGLIVDIKTKYPYMESEINPQYEKLLYFIYWLVEGDTDDGFPYNRRDLMYLRDEAK